MISVIIPVYNVEQYISRCLDSVIAQTYRDIEILLIDDGSTDSSGTICDAYQEKDARIRVFHLSNGGVSVARNYGIENAFGNWACFVDADDWLEENALEQMLQFVKKCSLDLGIFSLRFEYKDFVKDYILDELLCTPKELFEQCKNLQSFSILICSPCNKLYNNKIIKAQNLRFSKGIKFGEDFIFNSQYVCHCKKIGSKNIAYYHYDCSVQNSGVKKVYPNHNAYILAMQLAFENALCRLQIDNGNELSVPFIGERWEYAIDNCINSSLTIKEKAILLEKWSICIPKEHLTFLSNRRGATKILIKSIINEGKIEIDFIERTLKKIHRSKKRKEFLRKIKNNIRKALKKR